VSPRRIVTRRYWLTDDYEHLVAVAGGHVVEVVSSGGSVEIRVDGAAVVRERSQRGSA
jgi:predicted Rdx family selenoprotein